MKNSFFMLSPHRSLLCGRRLLFVGLAAFTFPAVSAWAQLDKTDTAPIAPPSNAASGFASAERTVKQLAPGVIWIQEITPASAPGGPLVVNVVRVSPDAAKKDKLRSSLGAPTIWENNPAQGRETVSQISNRSNGLVAINAGFFTFSSGHPIGYHLENGEAVTEPFKNRTALCIDENGVGSLAMFTGSGRITTEDGATFPISGFNRRAGKGNELLVYTPHWFSSTLSVPDRYEVQLSGVKTPFTFNESFTGTVVSTNTGGGTILAPQTVVLSGGKAAAQFLQAHAPAGKKVTFRYDITPALGTVRQAIAGGPRLVDAGAVSVDYIEEGFDKSFTSTRHPRTAVGVTKDGSVLLLTVDGRQPFLSWGASLPEVGALLVKFGAVSGVNMDGGGSTEMTVRGSVVNSPSDGIERSVANAFVLETDDMPKETQPEQPLLSAFDSAMVVGATRSFALPTDVKKEDGAAAVWSMRGSVGFVSQSGKFVGLRAGTGFVIASLPDGRRYSAPVVVSPPPPPRPQPAPAVSPTPATPRGVPGS